MDAVERIEQLFMQHGDVVYDGARSEPVTALQHALQCAQLAEWAHAPSTLVAAALLHDIGHFFEQLPDDVDDRHEHRAVPFLSASRGTVMTTLPICLAWLKNWKDSCERRTSHAVNGSGEISPFAASSATADQPGAITWIGAPNSSNGW